MNGAARTSGWATRKLADFLASLAECASEQAVLAATVERTVQLFGADMAAIVAKGRVLHATGLLGHVQHEEIVETAKTGDGSTSRTGLGDRFVAVGVADKDDSARLLVARGGEPFTAEEQELLDAVARVLALTLRNLRLVTELTERQVLLERLSFIQRSISHRAETREVLNAIAQGLADLLGVEIAIIRLIDLEDRRADRLVAPTGLPAGVSTTFFRLGPSAGIGGHAMRVNSLVVANDYAAYECAVPVLIDHGVRAMMAAPVHEGDRTTGAVIVGTCDPDRSFSLAEQEMLLAFADHASLALSDAEVMAGLQRAFHDPLTKLPNRTYFAERLEDALREPGAHGRIAVLFIDLDRFKSVNDSLGHLVGDELLTIAAQRISECVRPEDVVARMGGDEFAVLIEKAGHAREAEVVAERIAEALANPVDLGGRSIVVSASVGVSFDDPDDPSGIDLLHAADTAMYHAKSRGRGRVRTYRRELGEQARRRLDVETALRGAVERSELTLHYQPLVDLQGDGQISAVEALLRWEHQDGPAVSVPEMISIAEDSGLIHPIGAWVIEEACRQHGIWRADLEVDAPKIHVNLSGHQLRDPGIPGAVAAALSRTGTDASSLALEITESVLIGNDAHSRDAIARLRSLGIHLSLDDFGKGYSSLAYLADLDIQSLKIDRSFVQRLTEHEGAGVIVRHVIAMAQTLGMSVVAEGTETPEQVERLRFLGSNFAQGYLFSRPVPAGQIAKLVSAAAPRRAGLPVTSPV